MIVCRSTLQWNFKGLQIYSEYFFLILHHAGRRKGWSRIDSAVHAQFYFKRVQDTVYRQRAWAHNPNLLNWCWSYFKKMCQRQTEIWSQPVTIRYTDTYIWVTWSPEGHSREWSTHNPFVPYQSAPPFLKYAYFEIWPWKFKANSMCVVKDCGYIVGPAFKQFTSFSFHSNHTTHSWHTGI